MAGLLLPAGGHKGYGLALMWEVLTGVLSGGPRFGADVTPIDEPGSPQSVSLLMVAVDPDRGIGGEVFRGRVDELITRLKASPPARGADSVSVPGERSSGTAVVRRATGISIPPEVFEEIASIAADLEVQL